MKLEIFTLTGMTMEDAVEELKKVLPDTAYKAVPRSANLTDISPAWRDEVATKVFGMCGIGWWYHYDEHLVEIAEIKKRKTDGGEYSQWSVLIPKLSLYIAYIIDGVQKISAPICSPGENENFARGHAYKGAVTTALGASFSHLCWQIRIYKNEMNHNTARNEYAEQERANLEVWQTWANGGDVMQFAASRGWGEKAIENRLSQLGPLGLNLSEQYYQIIMSEAPQTDIVATAADVTQSVPVVAKPIPVPSPGVDIPDPLFVASRSVAYYTKWQDVQTWLKENDKDPSEVLIALEAEGIEYRADRVPEMHKMIIEKYGLPFAG